MYKIEMFWNKNANWDKSSLMEGTKILKKKKNRKQAFRQKEHDVCLICEHKDVSHAQDWPILYRTALGSHHEPPCIIELNVWS